MYVADELITGLYGLLNGAITGSVHDGEAPYGQGAPYTVIGAPTAVDDSLHDVGGSEMTVVLHVWSPSKKQVDTITAEIDALLHHGTLIIAGLNVWSITQDFVPPALPDADAEGNRLWHGVPRYRINLEEI